MVRRRITLGVDAHKDNHVGVAVDGVGRRLGTLSIPTTRGGYEELVDRANGFGPLEGIGIEGTGSFGAGLTRFLRAEGRRITVGFLFDTTTLLPNPTSQGSFGFFQHSCDLVRPVWYLATNETVGLLEQYASVLEGKPLMPPSRDVGEILLGELLRSRVRLLSRYRE